MNKINKYSIICLNMLAVEQNGGMVAVRNIALLDSAVESIYQTFDGKDLYPTIEEKAAKLGHNLITSHAFADGNKRTGLLAMMALLISNGIKVKFSDVELVKMGLFSAQGKMGYEDLLEMVNTHKQTANTPEK